jgi:hypothetical protein
MGSGLLDAGDGPAAAAVDRLGQVPDFGKGFGRGIVLADLVPWKRTLAMWLPPSLTTSSTSASSCCTSVSCALLPRSRYCISISA